MVSRRIEGCTSQAGTVVSHVDTRNKVVESKEARGQTADVRSRENVDCRRIGRKEYSSLFFHNSVPQQLADSL